MRNFRLRFPHVAIALLVLCLGAGVALGADVSSWKTPEYWSGTGLDAINAAGAYGLGFTGKGVTVGVVDSPFAPPVGEFLNKYPEGYEDYPFDDSGSDGGGFPHGIHVSGIIAAARDGKGMHGVAFNSMLNPVLFGEGDPPDEILEDIANGLRSPMAQMSYAWGELLDEPEVRIINNSWGTNIFLDVNYGDAPYLFDDFWENLAASDTYQELAEAAGELAGEGKLMIMAAGNEGHLSPSVTAGLPTFMERAGEDNSAYVNNMISVSSFNPRFASTDGRFISIFTNLGRFATEYTLLAPGTDIYSTFNSSTYGYGSGTSMAAPYVAGVAALVQEAFPYMDGKHLADVLLSTATPLTEADNNLPRYFIVRTANVGVNQVSPSNDSSPDEYVAYEQGDPADPLYSLTPTIYTYEHSGFDPNDLTTEEREYFKKQLGMDDNRLDDLLQAGATELSKSEYEALFGQGIVNAYRAVQGPGLFNANRLDPTTDYSEGEFRGDYALYGIDTKGYDSVWSNNIGERRSASGNELDSLPVGLRKQGAGLLYLAGANTYQGPTVVEGGGISLGMEGRGGAASLYGNVYVLEQGLFTGAGGVGYGDGSGTGGVDSQGILRPGLEGAPGSVLNVAGTVSSSGTLQLVLGQDGQGNMLRAGDDVDLSGTLSVMGSRGDPIRPYWDYNNLVQSGGDLTSSLPGSVAASPFIIFDAVTDGQNLSLRQRTRPLSSLSGVPGRTQAVAKGLEHMFHNLEGSPLQRQLDFLYNRDRGDFLDAANAMRGDIQAATLNNLPLTDRLRRILPAPSRGNKRTAPQEEAPEFFTTDSGRDSSPHVWMRPMAGYGKVDADNRIGQSSAETHMRGLAGGVQWEGEDAWGGLVIALGDSEVKQGGGRADIFDGRAGAYGGFSLEGFTLSGLFSGGIQHYKTRRHIPVQNGEDVLRSSFNGWSLGLGANASYDVLHGVSEMVALSPYAAVDVDFIRQDSREESGNDVFALEVDSKNLWRTSASAGLSVDVTPLDWLTLSGTGGYKRLLNGHRPGLDVGFSGDSSYRFTAVAPDEGRDFAVFGFSAEARLPKSVSVAAGFFGEESDRSRAYTGYVNMMFEW